MPTSAGRRLPAIVKNGKTLSAANVAETWVGFEAEKFFEDGLGREIHFANDADVAGVAEARYGAARDVPGSCS
jgi:polyphosphate glucokinase